MNDLAITEGMKTRMQGWAADTESLDMERFLSDLNDVGKGRFAQRLASIIAEVETTACPKYISNAVKYVADKCKR